MTTDVEMLESLALRLIQGMEEMKINWWCFDGWSMRRLQQMELQVKDTTNGSGSSDPEREHQPEGELAPSVAPRNDGRVRGSRTPGNFIAVSSSKSAKKVLKPTKRPQRLTRGTRRRLARRGWR